MMTDASDQKALRSQCHIPEYARLVTYDGFPSMVGFGQREGLEVSGQFQIDSPRVAEFESFAAADGWLPLPMPELIREKIRFQGMKVNLEARDGLYRCHTAGNNVLHATMTKPCSDPSGWVDVRYSEGTVNMLNDLILSVYERDRASIGAVVRSGY